MSLQLVKGKVTPMRLEERWELFSRALIGQDNVKENFKTLFESIFLTEQFGEIKNTTLGSVLLAGPTGTGKTQFAEALALAAHKNKAKLVKVSLGGFQSAHEVAKLLGSPPGYLGHRETTAILSNANINNAKSDYSRITIFLWDEVEKAHPDVFNALLDMLDRAEVRLGDNTMVSFENTFHVFTTNLGAIYDNDAKKFLVEHGYAEPYKIQKQKTAIGRFFRKEFLGRLTDIYYFTPLSEKDLHKIFQYEVSRMLSPAFTYASLQQFELFFRISDECIKELLRSSNTDEFGARDMIKNIHKHLYVPIAKFVSDILKGQITFDKSKIGVISVTMPKTKTPPFKLALIEQERKNEGD